MPRWKPYSKIPVKRYEKALDADILRAIEAENLLLVQKDITANPSTAGTAIIPGKPGVEGISDSHIVNGSKTLNTEKPEVSKLKKIIKIKRKRSNNNNNK